MYIIYSNICLCISYMNFVYSYKSYISSSNRVYCWAILREIMRKKNQPCFLGLNLHVSMNKYKNIDKFNASHLFYTHNHMPIQRKPALAKQKSL